MNKVRFDSNKYLKNTKRITIRKKKDIWWYHESNVLPRFKPNNKIKLLQQFNDDLEVIFCIKTANIENRKRGADYGSGIL